VWFFLFVLKYIYKPEKEGEKKRNPAVYMDGLRRVFYEPLDSPPTYKFPLHKKTNSQPEIWLFKNNNFHTHSPCAARCAATAFSNDTKNLLFVCVLCCSLYFEMFFQRGRGGGGDDEMTHFPKK
jgi:hypothetical protein